MNKHLLILVLSLLFLSRVYAQEGMWLLNQLDQLNLNEKGLEISIEQIYSPDKPCLAKAVVRLPTATGAFVSPNGLILTNHHVAYSAIQRASTKGIDYLTDGFIARNASDEIEAPGYTASVMIEMKDITSELQNQLKDIDDPQACSQKINELITGITNKIEDGKDDINAEVISMYNGKQYMLYVYKVYSDIRFVYAPPESIGTYGGDADNWMWPRHTGDFTFMRCYTAPDGSGRKYHEDNIPLKPTSWLPISTEDIDEGDFNFMIGFPGNTVRYRTSASVEWNLNHNYPRFIRTLQTIIDLIDHYSEESAAARISLADFRIHEANDLKNTQGMVDGMKRNKFLDKKFDFENELMNYINSDELLKSKYGSVIQDIKNLYAVLAETGELDNTLRGFTYFAGNIISTARTIYNFVKNSSEMNDEAKRKSIEELGNNISIRSMSFYEPFDRDLFKYQLNNAEKLPADQRIAGLEYVFDNNKSVDQFVDEMYSQTKLSDPEIAKSYLEISLDELKALHDPFIEMTSNMEDDYARYSERSRNFNLNAGNLRKKYIEAIYEWKGAGMYPDANFTMRFAYGYIRGYKPANAIWYQPLTTLSGVIEKNTGTPPFAAPSKLIELYDNVDYKKWIDPELNDLPVNFLSLLEGTGGNSGSPVLNSKGEVIGTFFDRNYEAMTSDWQYDEDVQRSISVDIRYTLFLIDKMVGADYLLKELGVR